MKQIGKDGFTLLEVLVAFGILSVSLGLVYQIFFSSLERTEQSVNMQDALAFAQSRLAVIGTEIPLENRTMSGQSDQGFDWSLEMIERQAGERSAREWRLYDAAIEVTWRDAGRQRDVRLATVKLKRVNP